MKNLIKTTFFLAMVIWIFSCQLKKKETHVTSYSTIGSIERLSEDLDQVVKPGAVIEILAEGFEWSEGPVWVPSGHFLLFSDIPPNRVYRWKEGDSISIYLEPSGYTGTEPRQGEGGSNGLLLDPMGRLVLCQHGDRRVAYMDASLDQPAARYHTLTDNFEGKKLNSPNDAVYHSSGELYFTDPPYGLEKQTEDPAKEIEFQGVYRLKRDGKTDLLTNELSRPNGIGFSPDEKTLYVANSDPDKALWMAYDVKEDGLLANGRVLYDATEKAKSDPGLPDGLKVHRSGYIFATGPGGVWILRPDGQPSGLIRTTQATANCAFNEDESVLFITADRYLLKVKIK